MWNRYKDEAGRKRFYPPGFCLRGWRRCPDGASARMAQERLPALFIYMSFQRRQAELILPPPDGQTLFLTELVRDNHLALLELRRAQSVSGLIADQMRVGIQDRRTVSSHAFDRRIAERRRSQHLHSLCLKLIA